MKKIARIGVALFAVFVCFLTTVCLYIRWQVEETTKKINFSLIEISDEVRELSVEERREWRGDAWKMSDEEYEVWLAENEHYYILSFQCYFSNQSDRKILHLSLSAPENTNYWFNSSSLSECTGYFMNAHREGKNTIKNVLVQAENKEEAFEIVKHSPLMYLNGEIKIWFWRTQFQIPLG